MSNRGALKSTGAEDKYDIATFLHEDLVIKAARLCNVLPIHRKHLTLVEVKVPSAYFNLQLQPQRGTTVFVDAAPIPLEASEWAALNRNPLLSHLTLIMTGQCNPLIHRQYVIKAVALALRDEFCLFSMEHARLQESIDIVSRGPTQASSIDITYLPPGSSTMDVTHVITESAVLSDLEEQGLLKHKVEAVQTLALAGQMELHTPAEVLYKAVGRVFCRL